MATISANGGESSTKDATNEQASDCESRAFIYDSDTDTGYRIVRNEKRKRVNTGDSQTRVRAHVCKKICPIAKNFPLS